MKHSTPEIAGQLAGKRAALYLRVSTGRQAESDLSIPDQRRQALAFCAARGWEVATEFVEAGASGMDDNRPELQRLLDMATSGGSPFDAVVVHSFRRSHYRGQYRRLRRSDASEHFERRNPIQARLHPVAYRPG